MFVGETVTLTAGSQGTVSSYQWQEWRAGSWANLGATTTSVTRGVTSNTAAVKFYRVVATYGSGTTGESAPVAVEWKDISLGVTSSPEYPLSASSTRRTVTLTAGGDVPSGISYQWQEDTGGGAWTHLATTTAPTTEVSSTARGTRKFRVAVTHAGVTAQSEPVYVTWDEWAIVAEMIRDLSSAVASSTDYTTAQTALLTCMNATRTGAVGDSGPSGQAETTPPAVTFGSFDDILSRYTGAVKARMETGGDCAATSTTMFNTNQSVTRDELAKLKVGNSTKAVLYAGWLATPQGQHFEANLGDPDELKFLSYLGATTFEPGEFTRPLYSSASGEEGASGTDGPGEEELPIVGTGLDCLPQSVSNGADLTLSNKLVVLNCLVFSTPHEFWVQGDKRNRDAEQLRRAIDSRYARFAWLNRGDWVCTDPAPDGPVPSCLKHDVAYGSLQKFGGLDATADLTSDPDGTELDEAWNPRNKALADAKFKADISKWGCQDQSPAAAAICALARFPFSNAFMADFVYFGGTARVNHKGWPVTTRDLSHINGHYRFIVCREPVVPTVSGLTASLTGSTITATWTLEQGCVPTTLANVSFSVTWFMGSRQLPTITSNINSCTARGNELTCSYHLDLPSGTSITGVSIAVVPLDWEYGGDNYGGPGKKGRRYTTSVGPLDF